ncbi:MAG: cupredoxin domain-containing protein [Deltaproteobacteria bacterium]|nr:cupredoxin domain-containing protein [Deltaproteobacteria bacterium]
MGHLSFQRPLVVLVLLLASTRPTPANAGPVRGVLKLAQGEDSLSLTPQGSWRDLRNALLPLAPPSVDIRQHMIVAIEGDAKAKPAYPPTVEMNDGRFLPPIIAVRPNTAVTFANKDWQMHLLEPTEKRTFMKPTTVEPGEAEKQTFTKEGSYTLHCSEVPHMRLTILVTTKAQLALPDNAGVFRFPDVRPGTYKLFVWFRGKWLFHQPLTVRSGRTTVNVLLPKLKKD